MGNGLVARSRASATRRSQVHQLQMVGLECDYVEQGLHIIGSRKVKAMYGVPRPPGGLINSQCAKSNGLARLGQTSRSCKDLKNHRGNRLRKKALDRGHIGGGLSMLPESMRRIRLRRQHRVGSGLRDSTRITRGTKP